MLLIVLFCAESNEALRSAARSVHFEEEILREKFHIHLVQGGGMNIQIHVV
jgi:hypothetical protein